MAATENWRKSKDIKRQLHEFNQRHATCPPDMKQARALHTEVMAKLDTGMTEKGWKGRHEYRGSSYEGVKIQGGNEFDVMRVHRRDDLVVKTTNKPGYYILQKKPGTKAEDDKLAEQDGNLSTVKVNRKFKGDLQRTINSDPTLSKVTLVDHGPAVELDVKTDTGAFSHSTDYVPAMEVNGMTFVAKPPKVDSDIKPTEWKKSDSMQEKDAMEPSNQPTLRTLKAMRDIDSPMQGLDTYHYKTAVIHQSLQPGWSSKNDVEKITDSMSYLKLCTDNKKLPSHADKKVNLFSGKSDVQLRNIGDRLDRLSTKEAEFSRLLSK